MESYSWIGVAIIVVVVIGLWMSIDTMIDGWREKDSKKVSRGLQQLRVNLITVALAVSVFRFASPSLSNLVFYQGVFMHLGQTLSLALAGVFAYASYRIFNNYRSNSMGFVYGALAIITAVSGVVLSTSFNAAALAQEFRFERISTLIPDDHGKLRFTPEEVAYNLMHGRATESGYTLEHEDIDAVDVNNGFGYVGPMVPDGTVGTWIRANSGYMVFDDLKSNEDPGRIRKVNQTQAFGEGMLLFDNLERHLYNTEWSAFYPEVYYLQLDPKVVDSYTAVAPKFEYRYRFPFASIPVWAGVVLVHSDGRTENLNTTEALADPRLKGKQINHRWYLRKLVDAQNYLDGFYAGWYVRPGQIKIPDLPGRSQMPFYFRGADNHDYAVIATEPPGTGAGLYRMYYLNVSTGARLVYEFAPKAGLSGPERAVDHAQIAGHTWAGTGQQGGGGERLLEPRYLVRDGKLFWMLSATPAAMSTVNSTIVVDAQTSTPVTYRGEQEFKTREIFFSWLNGAPDQAEVPASSSTDPDSIPATSDRLERLEQLLRTALQEVESLKGGSKK
ncbi:MAG: hypothetical protein IT290_01520 [Deltaproteobacteria bacterium]|nr:hypothetical protein [Deltaproteobacteria bacterium]